jgi:hypothetical protein
MLSQLDKYRSILLQYDQGTFGAVLVTCLEESLVLCFGQSIILFEGAAVVVDVEGESADDSSSTLGGESDVASVVANSKSTCSGEGYTTHDIQAFAGLGRLRGLRKGGLGGICALLDDVARSNSRGP